MPAIYPHSFLSFAFILYLSVGGNLACKPKGKGEFVVKEVVDIINGLGIFPKDHKFLCRVAWVESKYGQDRTTYRKGYCGGIWQVPYLVH